MCRPAPASSPTASPPSSSRNASTRRTPVSAPPRKPANLPAPPSAGNNHAPWAASGDRGMGWLHRLDRLIGHIFAVAQWLALPLLLLLFLQWPLRDIVRGYPREANDLGQIIFALFVAVSVTGATRAGTHLAADTLAQRYSARTHFWIMRIGAPP